jgi:hypothetical protein
MGSSPGSALDPMADCGAEAKHSRQGDCTAPQTNKDDQS